VYIPMIFTKRYTLDSCSDEHIVPHYKKLKIQPLTSSDILL
jgi:hypothetical protein